MSTAIGRRLGENGLGPSHLAAALCGGVALAAIGALVRPEAPVAASFALGAITAAIAWEDWRALRVPDLLNLLLFLCGIAVAVEDEGLSGPAGLAARILIDVIVCGGALWLVRIGYRRLTGRDGLGLGDVKFAAAAAPWIGWALFPSLILVGSLLALVFVSTATLLSGGRRRDPRIPFATCLAPALAIVWLALVPH